MASSSSRRWRRRTAWAVPVVTGAVAVGLGAASLSPSASATEHPVLPPLSAAELLAAVGSSSTQALSGTVVETARLGLPDLPGADDSAALSWQSLVTGSHTARVWVDGPDRQRLALLGQLAESDVVRSGRDVWSYSSTDQTATHALLPEHTADDAQAPAPVLTPQQAAARALAAVDPTTAVTVEQTAVVAERPVYTLVLTPRDARSTVRKVTLAVDSETKVPLRVQVFSSGSAAALETGFTDVSFARPDTSVFRFTPPAGARVEQGQLPGAGSTLHGPTPDGSAAGGETPSVTGEPRVVGTGWTSVVVLPAGSADALTSAGGGLVDQLTTAQPDGSRLIRSALVNALLTTDGRVLIGAVAPDLLQQAAAG